VDDEPLRVRVIGTLAALFNGLSKTFIEQYEGRMEEGEAV
jgi:hypothetical protein